MAAAPLDLGGKAAARIRPRACRAVGDLLSGCLCHGVWRPLGARRHQRGGRHPEELGGGTWMARRLPSARRSGGRTGWARSGAPRSRDSIPRLRAVFGGQPLWHPPIRVVVTWLILPVVICLSQRLSHACLSISNLYGETANGSLNQLSFI